MVIRGAGSNQVPQQTKRNLPTNQETIGHSKVKTTATAALTVPAMAAATQETKSLAKMTGEKHLEILLATTNLERKATIMALDGNQDQENQLQTQIATSRTGHKIFPPLPVWICCWPHKNHLAQCIHSTGKHAYMVLLLTSIPPRLP